MLWIKAATERTKKKTNGGEGGEKETERRGGGERKRERSKTVQYAVQSGKPERNCHSLFEDSM